MRESGLWGRMASCGGLATRQLSVERVVGTSPWPNGGPCRASERLGVPFSPAFPLAVLTDSGIV